MRKKLATTIAFVITPIVASFMANAPLLLEKGNNLQLKNLSSVLLFTLLFLPYPVAAVLVFGLPMYLIFRKFNIIFWWTALMTGGVGGFAMSFITTTYPETPVREVIDLTISGMVASTCFWVVWRLGNTDKTV